MGGPGIEDRGFRALVCIKTMGIQRLNQFLRARGGAHVQEISVTDLRGKRVAVDASIYMYKFLGEQCLLPGMYQMGVLFRRWGVEPVFVFDGAPPKEKHAVQQERQKRKEEAYVAHQQLEREVKAMRGPVDAATSAELALLRRKSLRLGRRRVEEVRALLGLLGLACVDAPGEADAVCAGLVASGDCWACLSDDTDLFACGCPRVLRRLVLAAGTCDLYDWEGQRNALGITQPEFHLVCAAAGCDYGPGVPEMGLQEAWECWGRWVEQGRPGALAERLVAKGGRGEEGLSEALRGAAAVFERMAGVSVAPPPSSACNRTGTRAFLEERGFIFADE